MREYSEGALEDPWSTLAIAALMSGELRNAGSSSPAARITRALRDEFSAALPSGVDRVAVRAASGAAKMISLHVGHAGSRQRIVSPAGTASWSLDLPCPVWSDIGPARAAVILAPA
jgi:hypothetical protein